MRTLFTPQEANSKAALNIAAFGCQLSLPRDDQVWDRGATPTRYY